MKTRRVPVLVTKPWRFSRATAPQAGLAAPPLTAAASPVHRLLWGTPTPAPPQVMRQVDPRSDPTRFETLHQNLFVNAPTAAGGTRQPWVAGTNDVQIKAAFKASVQQQVEANPLSLVGQMSSVTTQQDAEAAAVTADADLHAKFPQIASQLSQADIRRRVKVFAPDFEPQNAPSADFLANWVENQLPNRTTIDQFAINPPDAAYQRLVTDLAQDSARFPLTGILAGVRAEAVRRGFNQDQTDITVDNIRTELAGKSWSWLFNRLASRTGAFEGLGRVFVSQSLPAARRRPNLLHELVHGYADADYRRWVDATTSPRLFNEGFTEILTREALTPQELADRRSYQAAVDVIRPRVMAFVSVDDLARAFFHGEVWRIEGKSQVSQQMFERQVGLAAGATRAQEIAQSRGGPGIVQVVEPGARFRFLNFGTDRSEPKPEHEAFLRDVILPMVRADATLRLRFVGHADETGPAGHNLVLSRGRAAAFYRLAERLGVPRNQLPDRSRPAGGGITEPTAGNADVHGRTMNRRVELFLTRP
ncbi:MAG TPA: OmpA family protein [Thermoanaerobaculia bacterium]|jgi:outer membrane protein OmpA-like peptidoglycan-associated protein|nr:OmpA family protein [Thermoanaerobaculia bacterium]